MPPRRDRQMAVRRPSLGPRAERAWATVLAVAGAWLASLRQLLRRLRTAAGSVRAALISVGSGWREAAIALGAYGVYSLVRGIWGGTLAEGRENAAALVDLEQRLGIHIEGSMQAYFVDHGLGMPFWNLFYVGSQVIVLPLTLFLVYRYRRDAYAFLRNMAILSWAAGLVWYALQPVAPPRLLESGFTDTVSDHTFVDLNSGFIEAFYNPVAAMPSLHVGMAPVVAWALWKLTPYWWSRALGLLYPVLVVVAIVVTGNHYVLDIVGGLAVVLPAAAIAAALSHPPSPERIAGLLRLRRHGTARDDTCRTRT